MRNRLKPWVRPWMVHCVGWVVVFPLYLVGEIVTGWKFSVSATRADIREMLGEGQR